METGKDKVKKICDILKKETIEPAKVEAEEIVANARFQAEEIIAQAKKTCADLEKKARLEIERERSVFQASLHQACRQTLESLRQSIEEKLFNPELKQLISKHTQDPKILAEITTAVVKALERAGIDADLNVFIPAAVPARAVNSLLAQAVLDKLKDKSVLLSPIGGGIEVKLRKENITIDISDTALKELISRYIRKDFREILFGSQS